MTFNDLTVNEKLILKLAERQITKPTQVQEQVIPLVLQKDNVAFQSETGTGKTFAYLLPLLTRLAEKLKTNFCVQPHILITAPTNELAAQIKNEAEFLCASDFFTLEKKIKTALFIGSSPIKRQLEKLKEKPHIIIGGPARLLELIRLKKLKTADIFTLVFDEVDRSLLPELRDFNLELLQIMPPNTQIIACSATLKPRILELLPVDFKKITIQAENVLQRSITHWAFHAEKRDKIDTLRSLIFAIKNTTEKTAEKSTPSKILVFSAETAQIANIVSKLQYKKVDCMGLHAKTDKIERKKALDNFKNGKCAVLITSDLTSRGLDIADITHIIQMDLSDNEDFFIHRAGRTARAGKQGINIVIGDEWELKKLSALEKKLHIIIYPKILFNGEIKTPSETF